MRTARRYCHDVVRTARPGLGSPYPPPLPAVDHYYLPLDRQPRYQARKERGDVDYDSIESMDVKLVQVGQEVGPCRWCR